MALGIFAKWREKPACTRCGRRHSARRSCDDTPQLAGYDPRVVPALAAPLWAMRAPAPLPPPYIAEEHPVRAAVIALRWTAGAITSGVAVAAAIAAYVFIDRLTQARRDPSDALAAALIAIVAGVAFGLVPMYLFVRVYARVVLALLSLVLFTGGFLMLCYAPALRQLDSRGIAEYRAFAAFLWFGGVFVVAGILLAARCVAWTLEPQARHTLQAWARLLGSGYGVLLGISGMITLLGLFTVANQQDASAVQRSIEVATIAMLSLAPGLLLTYQGISASMGEGSGEFRAPRAFWGFLLFAALLLVGGLNMKGRPFAGIIDVAQPIAAPMPLFHVLAAALPALTFVAMASRGGVLRGRAVRSLTWRQVTLAAAISMTLGVLIAIYFESLGGYGTAILVLAHNGAFAHAEGVGAALDGAEYLLSEWEQFAINFVAAAVLAPIIEEPAKGLGVRFMMSRRTTRAQAFVLGAAAGAGFGFLEALLYGAGGIHDDLGGWWLLMLVRGGSTSLHVFNTGLVGLAWWHWSVARRQRTGWLLFAAAVGLHMLWNGLAVVVGSRVFVFDTVSDHTLKYIAYGLIAPIALLFVAGIPLLARSLRDAEPPPVAGSALSAMAPWLG